MIVESLGELESWRVLESVVEEVGREEVRGGKRQSHVARKVDPRFGFSGEGKKKEGELL